MDKYIKKTKIICTIGPASNTEEMLTKMIQAGMNICRLNLSHGGKESFVPVIEKIKKARINAGEPVAILLDTRGPEVRVGKIENDKAELKIGDKVTLSHGNFLGTSERLPITYDKLYMDLNPGSLILLDDGSMELKVLELKDEDIVCQVIIGGTIKNNKGINIPGVSLKLPALGDKDKDDIIAGIENGIDFIAASFVRSAEDVKFIRTFLDENGGEHVSIISKIENQQGIDNIDSIIDVTNAIMVARGDLGVEMAKERIPLVQKMVIKKCNAKAVPVITATQMLESMYNNPTPTRAELSDIANAIIDGTDVIMLSGESAAGKYPLLAVQQMAKSAIEVEKSLDYSPKTSMIGGQTSDNDYSVANAVSYAACNTAHCLNAAAIIVPTHGGKTAKLISSYHPKSAIIATTTNYLVQRQLQLFWGVTPILLDVVDSMDVLFFRSIETAKLMNILETGDIVVITAGVPLGGTHSTNIMKVVNVK
ncbi:MAG: pyruvate kinase [Clostridia bacterium]|nr:pyruvate kinase [Clostridia bacterium]